MSQTRSVDVTTEIASGFRIGDYLALRPVLALDGEGDEGSEAAWSKVLAAFRRRIEERFLRPIALLEAGARSPERTVPGFAILALDCLLIDTIQSFREGRVGTGDISPAKSFKAFLASPRFASFSRDDRREFFGYVRNGLLHNGETRGDWRVRADRAAMLSVDPATGARILNRRHFHQAVTEEFEEHFGQLVAGECASRERFLRRMDAICGQVSEAPETRLYFAYGSNLHADEIARTAPTAEPGAAAFLPGHRLVFKKHSISRGGDAATLEKKASQLLWGFLYRVTREEERALAKREAGYSQRTVRVWQVGLGQDCAEARPVDAFTFVAKQDCARACGPTDDYLRLVVEGARSRGLPEDYLAVLAGSPGMR